MTLRPLNKSVNTENDSQAENSADEWSEQPTKVVPRESMLEVVSTDRWRPILDWVELVDSEVDRRIRSGDLAEDVKQEVYATLLAGDQALLSPETVQAVVKTITNRAKRQERIRSSHEVNLGVDLEGFENATPTDDLHSDNTRIDRFWRVRRVERTRLLLAGFPHERASREAQGSAVRECVGDTPMRDEVDVAVDGLSKREREVVYRYFWQGQSEFEIAQALALQQPNVSRTLKRAINKLKKRLGTKID